MSDTLKPNQLTLPNRKFGLDLDKNILIYVLMNTSSKVNSINQTFGFKRDSFSWIIKAF